MYYFNFLRVGKLLRIPLQPQSKVYGKAARSLGFAAAAAPRRRRRHANLTPATAAIAAVAC